MSDYYYNDTDVVKGTPVQTQIKENKPESELAALRARIAELEAQVDTVTENALRLLFDNACKKHSEKIKHMTFADFVELESSCPYCAKERVAELENGELKWWIERVGVLEKRIAELEALGDLPALPEGEL